MEKVHYLLQEEFQGDYAAGMRECLLSSLKKFSQGVCLDFQQVKAVDSVGLGVLVTIQKHAQLQGREFMLQGMSEEIYSLFRRTRLCEAFSIQKAG